MIAAGVRARGGDLALVVLGVGVGLVSGVAFARSVPLGVAAVVGALVVFLAAVRPVALGVIALVGVFAAQRLGSTSAFPGGSAGVSYSDALLAAAVVIAVPMLVGSPGMRRLRPALAGVAVYLACLLPTVFLNPSHRAYLEWAHRLSLVAGSLVVGAWIAREHVIRPALRWLVATTCLVAVLSVVDTVSNGFQPAFPLGLNKNFVGALLGAVVALVVMAPAHFGLPHRLRVVVILLIAAGLLASQSRGGMLAAVAGMLIAFVLNPRAHSRQARGLAAVVMLVFVVFVGISVHDELSQTKAEVNNSSIGVRRNVERVTRDIWRTSPVDGVGLKYFTTGLYGPLAQPANNAFDNELAESGVIGLAGFVVLQAAVIGAGFRRRRGDQLMIAAVGCVAGDLLHGMIDIYWTAGTVTLPFILLGMALGRDPAEVHADDGTEGEGTGAGRIGDDGVGSGQEPKIAASALSSTRPHS